MRIENANNMGAQAPAQMSAGTDSISKNIQSRIQKLQQDLQKLSEDEKMNPKEKMKKKQEIQQQIADLTRELRQHEMELRKEQQQKQNTSMDNQTDPSGTHTKAQNKPGTGFSEESMQVIISAESSMKQARIQGSVATQMKGRAGVLKAEIKQDGDRGNTEAKQQELAEVEHTANKALNQQMQTLSDANRALAEAGTTESTKDKKAETSSAKKDEKTEAAEDKEEKQKTDAAKPQSEDNPESLPENYARVDVRL